MRVKHGLYQFDDGSREWWADGNLHREDGPAVEHADGTEIWYLNGLRHRTDGPAVTSKNGASAWYYMGVLHRTDGPALIEADGTETWLLMGRTHRDDGPAYFNPSKNEYRWFYGGDRHTFSSWVRVLGKTPAEITALRLAYDIQTKGS